MVTIVNRTNVTPSTRGSWTDVDVSSYVPDNAVGVVLYIDCPSDSTFQYGVRKNGSTDETKGDNYIVDTFLYIGIDENGVFETWLEDASAAVEGWGIYLAGYVTDSEGSFLTNTNSYSISDNTWMDVDVSGDTGSETAKAVFGFYFGTGGLGYRENGSTDDHKNSYNDYHCTGISISVDGNEIFEANSWDETLYISGWLTEVDQTWTNTKDYSLDDNTQDQWRVIDYSNDIPSGDKIACVKLEAALYTTGIREKGSSWSVTGGFDSSNGVYQSVDDERKVEEYHTWEDNYLWGYTSEPSIAPTEYTGTDNLSIADNSTYILPPTVETIGVDENAS
jgi:hypothetical protein